MGLVVPKCVLDRKVVKGKQDFFIFLQAFAGFWEFDLVTGDKPIICCLSCLAQSAGTSLAERASRC